MESETRLLVKGFPPKFTDRNLKALFEPFGVVTDARVALIGNKNRGFGFVGFDSALSANAAMRQLNKAFVGAHRITVSVAAPRSDSRRTADIPPNELDPLRLYLTNIPFEVDGQTALAELRRTGAPTAFQLLSGPRGASQGRGFASYANEAETLRHFTALEGSAFLGRRLHVERCRRFAGAQTQTAAVKAAVAAEPSSLKRISKQKLLARLEKPATWSAMFLNPSLVLERVADKLGTTRRALLADGQHVAAAVQTLAEKELLAETTEFLQANGIDTKAFSLAPSATPRSTTVIIVKNLPLATNHAELSALFARHGQVLRVLLPPNRALAVVWYARPDHAHNAFELLGLFRLHGTPLYLEWAPAPFSASVEAPPAVRAEECAESPVLVLKNLSFEATAADVEGLLRVRGIAAWRALTLPRPNGKPLGCAFVEFASAREAAAAQRALHGELLKGRVVEPLFSQRAANARSAETPANAESTKLILRNIAFNATKEELSELVGALVAFKRVRFPKKADGSARGFAFLEFESVEDCRAAMETIQNLHFYGRRIVAEFAKE